MSDHELFLGDSFEYIKQIPDHSVDFILTDPPYNLGRYSTGNIKMSWEKILITMLPSGIQLFLILLNGLTSSEESSSQQGIYLHSQAIISWANGIKHLIPSLIHSSLCAGIKPIQPLSFAELAS